jgi:hypothetical protein
VRRGSNAAEAAGGRGVKAASAAAEVIAHQYSQRRRWWGMRARVATSSGQGWGVGGGDAWGRRGGEGGAALAKRPCACKRGGQRGPLGRWMHPRRWMCGWGKWMSSNGVYSVKDGAAATEVCCHLESLISALMRPRRKNAHACGAAAGCTQPPRSQHRKRGRRGVIQHSSHARLIGHLSLTHLSPTVPHACSSRTTLPTILKLACG